MSIRKCFGLLLFVLLMGGISAETIHAEPTDIPTPIANDMSGFTMYENVLYWYTNPTCPPIGPNRAAGDPVTIQRRRSSGGEVRVLFSRNDPRPVNVCNPYEIRTNLSIDGTYLYWLDTAGLQRLPLTAIVGDAPTQLFSLPNTDPNIGRQVMVGDGYVYVMLGGVIRAYNKATGAVTIVYAGSPPASNLQFDGRYLYFIASGSLKWLDPINGHAQLHLLNDVQSYHVPGLQTVCGAPNTYQWMVSASGNSSYSFLNYAGNPIDQLHLGDFNGDGTDDVFSTLLRQDGAWQWVYSASGQSSYINIAYDFTAPEDLRFGDFNGDGKTDVFAIFDIGGGNYQWKYSSGGAASYVNLRQSTIPLSDLRFGDFDGDNKTDVFTVIPQPNGIKQWAYSPGGTGAFINIAYDGLTIDQLGFGDFNADNKTDVFVASDLGNGLYQWRFSSGGFYSYTNLRQEPYGIDDVRFGDFVGNGFDDVFVTEARPDGNWQWKVSDGGSGALQNVAYASQPLEALRFGKLIGDAKTDVFAVSSRDFCRTMRPVFYGYEYPAGSISAALYGGPARWHDLNSGQNGTLYTNPRELFNSSNQPFAEFDSYADIATTDNYYFLAERYKFYCTSPSGCFVTTTRTTFRRLPLTRDVFKGYGGGSSAELFVDQRTYNYPPDADIQFGNDQEFIHWRDNEQRRLQQLSVNAAALQRINLRVTGIEVTQGIQSTTNSVRLISGKETVARVFVAADGADVRDVSAILHVYRNGVLHTTLNPERRITVRSAPDRNNLNHQFIFHLPLYAVDGTSLRVQAVVNPLGYPLEPANSTADNTLSSATFNLVASRQMDIIFAEFSYPLNNATQRPQGTSKNAAWIRHVYPVGYTYSNGAYESGLDWEIWEIDDANLTARIDWGLATCTNQATHVCGAYYTCDMAGTMTVDNRNLCASDYVNGRLNALRSQRAVGSQMFLYGEIRDPGGTNRFPRGQAGVGRTSTGPDGTSWDGYYAGHEVGHTAGLGHPLNANGQCGLDGSDTTPNHPNARIGPTDNSVNGLSFNFFGSPMQLLQGSVWNDLMGYCNNGTYPRQWVSDQNYERMINNLSATRRETDATLQAGDWLAVFGSLSNADNSAALTVVERWDEAAPPAIVAGPYAVRLRNVGGTLLAATAFSAETPSDSGREAFQLVVPFAAGTRTVQIVRLLDNVVLATKSISVNPPQISNVTLAQNGSNANITWTASDPDSNPLTFAIHVSHDQGATFRALALGVTGNNKSLPLSQMGGGSTLVQVVASDGVQTARANSPTVNMTVQAPIISNFTPDCSQAFNWKDAVNFSADVYDPQDGSLDGEALAWYLNGDFAGYGTVGFQNELRTGDNQVELFVTNSYGVTASQTCTLRIGDNLRIPATQLAVSPTQVEWSVASGNRVIETATVQLSNLGGGSLTWTASSNQAWLTLDVVEGSVPGSVVVSADSAGLQSGSLNYAAITFTGYDSGRAVTNSVELPITLWVDHPGYLPHTVGGAVPTALGLVGQQTVATGQIVWTLLIMIGLAAASLWLRVRLGQSAWQRRKG